MTKFEASILVAFEDAKKDLKEEPNAFILLLAGPSRVVVRLEGPPERIGSPIDELLQFLLSSLRGEVIKI